MKRVRFWFVTALGAAVPTAALAAEHPLSFSGDGWVALGIIAVLVGFVALLIRGTISVADRSDTSRDDGGGLPWFGGDDDDDDRPRRKKK